MNPKLLFCLALIFSFGFEIVLVSFGGDFLTLESN